VRSGEADVRDAAHGGAGPRDGARCSDAASLSLAAASAGR
jgi:hypothetical protein